MPRNKKYGKRSFRDHQTKSRDSSIVPCRAYIDNLPDGLLMDIFLILMQERSPTMDHNTPSQLAAVCRHWKILVMNAPLLWTSIYIPSRTQIDPFIYFERSQRALLDIYFDSVSVWIRADSDLFSRTSDAIAKHISRIRSLTIRVWELEDVHPIFHAWKDLDAPSLKSLSISSVNGHPNLPAAHSLPGFSCPISSRLPFCRGGRVLDCLKLEGCGYQDFYPLPKLTSLEIDKLNMDSRSFKEFLLNCPLLEKLVIHQFEASLRTAQFEDEGQDIDASSLRLLAVKIDGTHPEDCSCALPNLNMRNLEYLELDFPRTVLNAHHASIVCQWKKMPNLKNLVIHIPSIWESDVSFFSELPNITDLEVVDFPPDAELALANILKLKNLKSITFDFSALPMTRSNAPVFLDVTRQHIDSQCPIAIRLLSSPEIDPRWLKVEAALGSRFSISTSTRKGYLKNGVNCTGNEDMWMSDDGEDEMDLDDFPEYDEFDWSDGYELEYWRESADDDEFSDTFEYENLIEGLSI